MTIIDVVRDLRRKGIEWRVTDGRLMFRPSTIPQNVKDCITTHKAALAAWCIPGWPENRTRPAWRLELAGEFPIGTFTRARAQVCRDSACRFGVSVEWRNGTDGLLQWSCPQCGLSSDSVEPVADGVVTIHNPLPVGGAGN